VRELSLKVASIKYRKESISPGKSPYVDNSRIEELRIVETKWDLGRLIRLLEELNNAYEKGCYMTVAMIVRIVDHIPPIFDSKNFDMVANNIPGPRSFRHQ
jgi:hypothetical protein